MYDFDPRADDPRDDGYGRELSQSSRGGLSNPRERLPLDARAVFTRHLELPRGPERERVRARDSDVTLRGSEVRTLATVGAFRVVPAGDLRDGRDRPLDPHSGDLRHLRDQVLAETIPTIGDDRALVVLTERGRDVLERNRWSSVHREELRWEAVERELVDRRDIDDERSESREPKARQEFYAGVRSGRSTRFAVHRPRGESLPAWTIRIVVPAHLKGAAQTLQKAAWGQLASPLREPVLTELRWYFERFSSAQTEARPASDRARFERCRRAFSSDRYEVLYRCWRQDGERVLTVACSPVTGKAMESGTGKIESLVLPHAYSHLAPMVGAA